MRASISPALPWKCRRVDLRPCVENQLRGFRFIAIVRRDLRVIHFDWNDFVFEFSRGDCCDSVLWPRSENSLACSRVMPYFLATFSRSTPCPDRRPDCDPSARDWARSCCRPSASCSWTSAPPATMTFAWPAMMRSAARAIDCSPEEQNRLIVIAEVSTGSRLAAPRLRHVHSRFGFGDRAAEDYVFDFFDVEAWRGRWLL